MNNKRMKLSLQNFVHFHFRDYFFDKFDVFYESTNEERIAILDDLWNKSFDHQENTIQKLNWHIITYVFEDKDGVEFFNGCEIMIVELPMPNHQGESYFIGLGVASPPKVYSSIMPFYMLLEYVDEATAHYTEYKRDENDGFKYFYINRPIEPTIPSFIKVIIERINKFSFEISIPAERNEKNEELTYNVYQFFDRVEDLDGFNYVYDKFVIKFV